MNEPLRQSYSHDEAMHSAMEWIHDEYGSPRDMTPEQRDRYHEQLGFLLCFVHHLHPKE
jgi:hypothetical protein